MKNLIKPLIFVVILIGLYVVVSMSGLLPGNLNLFKKKEMQFAETSLRVEEVKAVAKLFSQKYVNEIVIKKKHNSKGFFTTSTDNLVIIAQGTCFAGTDLSKMQQSDIKVIDSLTVQVTLPKATILESTINPSGFNIFISEGYWDTNLNAVQKVKTEAVKTLEKMAKHENILKKADAKSKALITTFMKSAGFQNVNVIFK